MYVSCIYIFRAHLKEGFLSKDPERKWASLEALRDGD
jgi:hypothetical protein